ncbi:hypothetical protein B5M09_001462 [Aphanomyces astaci]|uniref:Inward rectifier potassium channel C-terminal domain-containing protein n=1 Tax=Aphanomyces astaci TaxID=112090 RepID=A0A3R7WSF1_APHAT|nr:hypothetical protein B5M09_001462 [Aphanomyces astaci]
MTIGYGAPTNDIFYGGCSSMALLLTVESVSGIFLDSLCFGVFFVRFSRATRRATSVVFSKHAVVQQIHGEYCVLFQVCERRRHQLVEAHVRCYGVAKRHSDAPFQTLPMRIQSPDDNLGAFVLLALPQLIARYSYTADDIKWHHTFAPCVSRDPVTHGAVVDFDLFHTLVPAPSCPSTVV